MKAGYYNTPEYKSKKKKELEDLLKKYPYGWDVFYLKYAWEGKEHELTHYSKHFSAEDEYLEIDNPHLCIPWSNVIEVKLCKEV
jgi:hypothetical protein